MRNGTAQRIVDSASRAALAVDGDDRIVTSNPAASELLGRDPGELRGRKLHEVLEIRDLFGNVVCTSCGLREMARRGEVINAFEADARMGVGTPLRMVVAVDAVGNGIAAPPQLVFRLQPDRRSRRRGRRQEDREARKAGKVRAASKNGLTKRQLEVLKLVAEGFSTREVAADLGISVNTVRCHQQGILRQLDAHHLARAVAIAIRSSLI